MSNPRLKHSICFSETAVFHQQNVRFAECIQIGKTDNNVKLAIECTAESENEQLAENLMNFFTEEGYNREAFTALIRSCYAHLGTDVIMELAWENGLKELAMPYRMQLMRDFENVYLVRWLQDPVESCEGQAVQIKALRWNELLCGTPRSEHAQSDHRKALKRGRYEYRQR